MCLIRTRSFPSLSTLCVGDIKEKIDDIKETIDDAKGSQDPQRNERFASLSEWPDKKYPYTSTDYICITPFR